MVLLLTVAVIVIVLPVHFTTNICSRCPKPSEASFVVKYCTENNSTGTLNQNASCCINTSAADTDSSLVGVDLSNCGLTSIMNLINSNELKVLMLEGNEKLQIRLTDFRGLTALEYLSLPSQEQCPGGNWSWNVIEYTNRSVICHGEINLCKNASCANNNSECVLVGPGDMECHCLPGYYGYKCLRQGTFPAVNYSVILSVCTVVISVFLWCTQRRRVNRSFQTG